METFKLVRKNNKQANIKCRWPRYFTRKTFNLIGGDLLCSTLKKINKKAIAQFIFLIPKLIQSGQNKVVEIYKNIYKPQQWGISCVIT